MIERKEFILFCAKAKGKSFLKKNKWLLKIFDKYKGERWRDIPGYERQYQASTFGRIKRLGQYRSNGHGKKKWLPEQLTTIRIRPNGYETTCVNGKKYLVHRLICAAFHFNKHNKPEVNHRDAIKYNNKPKNLKWATKLENTAHAKEKNLYNNNTPGHISHLKKMNEGRRKQVSQYTLKGRLIKTYPSVGQCQKETGILTGNISAVCRGVYKQTNGFKFKYVKKRISNSKT